MKFLYFILLLFISFSSSGQDGFVKQLKSIVNDTANGFPNFRGEVKTKGEMSSGKSYIEWVSLSTLENTSENNIKHIGSSSLSAYMYNAEIADLVNDKDGEKICDEWKDKIAALLGAGSKVTKYHANPFQTGKYGWTVSSGELSISIDLIPTKTPDLNKVAMGLSYTVIK